MNDRDPYTDVEVAGLPPGDDDETRTAVVDWRALLLLFALAYVVLLAWTNWESEARVRLVFCADITLSIVWIVGLSLLLGAGMTLVFQGSYRRFRAQKEALERAALAAAERPSRSGEGAGDGN